MTDVEPLGDTELRLRGLVQRLRRALPVTMIPVDVDDLAVILARLDAAEQRNHRAYELLTNVDDDAEAGDEGQSEMWTDAQHEWLAEYERAYPKGSTPS